MKRNVSGTDGSFGRSLGDRAFWVTDGPDHECDCPGPPPSFHLPPPPRPRSVVGSDCSENSTSRSETCENVPVIDAEYHYVPMVPPFAVMLIAAVAVAVSLLIGIYLVLIKRRKMQQNLFPRKSCSQNRCDPASANSVIYEDLTNLHHQMLSPNCPAGQTTLPSMEMIDSTSLPERGTFTSAFVRPALPSQDLYDPRELYNPVYEELSNASAEGGETDSEGLPAATMSEDEFAADELSLAEEADVCRRGDGPNDGFPRKYACGDICREVDSSDADDRCKFLGNSVTLSSLPVDRAGKERIRGSYFRSVAKGPRSLMRRKARKNTAPSSQFAPSENCSELHEGFLLKRILQVYPDVTGLGLQYAKGLRNVQHSPGNPAAGSGHPESPEAFGGTLALLRHKPEIFSPFGQQVHGFGKHQSRDSSLGSDSGYSNNTSGGKSSSKLRPEHPPDRSDAFVSS